MRWNRLARFDCVWFSLDSWSVSRSQPAYCKLQRMGPCGVGRRVFLSFPCHISYRGGTSSMSQWDESFEANLEEYQCFNQLIDRCLVSGIKINNFQPSQASQAKMHLNRRAFRSNIDRRRQKRWVSRERTDETVSKTWTLFDQVPGIGSLSSNMIFDQMKLWSKKSQKNRWKILNGKDFCWSDPRWCKFTWREAS